MITRSRRFLDKDGLPTMEMLRSVISDHSAAVERMKKLRDMYNAQNPILTRTRRDGLPNNRIAHAYARYITAVASGYLLGKPVAYSMTEENDTLQQIQEIFRRGSESAENAQIARDQSIYGKGVEYVHVDDGESPMPHTTALSPLNAFVVYSDTYDAEPLFGVYYIPRTKEDGTEDGWQFWVMSRRVIAKYEAASLLETPRAADEAKSRHFFGGVPLVEYWNDETEKGDFEWVLSQIEAYDKLQSDRVNDKEQFVDRLLVITGAVLETDDEGRTPQQQLKEDRALQLPDSQSRAEYLTSAMDEAGNQILRNDLVEDIHKMSLVPDLSDRNFATNASGVAMKYKLWGLDQLIGTKERWFEEGLRARLKLYVNFLKVKGAKALDVADVKITFTRALPANLTEAAQNVKTARDAGAMSRKTAIKTLHAGEEWTEDDVAEEEDAIRQEQAEAELTALKRDGAGAEAI